MRRILKWIFRIVLLLVVLAFLFVFVAYWTSSNECGRTPAPKNPMKAIVYCDYGVDKLSYEEVEKPVPTDDQMLVRVHAASINPLDWHFIEGKPYAMRPMAGLRKPKQMRLGVDFAGTVEEVGKNVKNYKPGNEVFGGKDGAFAQYLCVRADRAVALKPDGVSFEQAASLPIAGITALQALRDRADVRPGQKVLINGASGGVGTFAVQIAKSLGGEVTGVCSTHNLELVKSLGAAHVIDYTKEDFTKGVERYDVLFDNVVNHSLGECRRVLTPKGRYVLVGGGGPNDGPWLGPGLSRAMILPVYRKFVSEDMGGFFMAQLNHRDLDELTSLIEAGQIRPVIDRSYKLSQLPEAIRYLEQGHARGKVIIAVE